MSRCISVRNGRISTISQLSTELVMTIEMKAPTMKIKIT